MSMDDGEGIPVGRCKGRLSCKKSKQDDGLIDGQKRRLG